MTQKMKLDHIIYKVDNLDKAVELYKKNGFNVEYGKMKKSYNAVIYFAKGPYLELLERTGMPSFMKKILVLFAKRDFVNRLNTWENSKEGLIGLGIGSESFDLNREKQILNREKIAYFNIKSVRRDSKNRKLRFNGIFTNDMRIPILGAKVNINVRPPLDYVHPNGVKCIKGVSFGTKKEFIPIIEELCDDKGLRLFVGNGVKNLEFEYKD